MEGQSGEENPLELMLLNFHGDANDVCYGTGVEYYTQNFVSAGENRPPLGFPHWSHCSSTPQNYFEFFTKNSAFGEGSTANASENMSLPSGSTVIGGDSVLQRELLFKNPGSACPSELAGCSAFIDSGCLNSNSYMLKSDNYEVPLKLTCLQQRNEGQEDQLHENLRHQKHSQNHTPWIQGPSSNIGDVSQHRPRVTVAESVFLSEPHKNAPRQRRAARDDRQRRTRIAEKICALQQLLPYYTKGSQAAVLDNVIDYIKYLQFQMTELLESRLGGEAVYAPLVYIKERGHFLVDGQRNESLEEMIGNLVEENPTAAIKLLESKGFAVAPIALADRFI